MTSSRRPGPLNGHPGFEHAKPRAPLRIGREGANGQSLLSRRGCPAHWPPGPELSGKPAFHVHQQLPRAGPRGVCGREAAWPLPDGLQAPGPRSEKPALCGGCARASILCLPLAAVLTGPAWSAASTIASRPRLMASPSASSLSRPLTPSPPAALPLCPERRRSSWEVRPKRPDAQGFAGAQLSPLEAGLLKKVTERCRMTQAGLAGPEAAWRCPRAWKDGNCLTRPEGQSAS